MNDITINRFKKFFLVLSICFVMAITTTTGVSEELKNLLDPFDHETGKVYTIIDEEGQVVLRTARRITVGDEYINTENNHYRVVSVEDEQAVARLLEKVVSQAEPLNQGEGWLARVNYLLQNSLPVQVKENERKVAVYNSHGAESYIQGDGTESQDPGGIIDVGNTFSQALEQKGTQVIRSEEPHTPHDAGAYMRSRRTAEESLQGNPDALIDVHRDAAPEEEYLTQVDNQERVQIQLIVGRQNQNMANNREFAEGLKKVADENYPGLVKGILMARGNYNQDLSPRSILIEVGSHTNNKDGAEESVSLFADVVNIYLYGTAEGEELAGAPTTMGGPGGTALRAMIWLLFGAAVIGGLYMVISTGGIDEIKEKIRKFKNKEFANFLGAPQKNEECDNEKKECKEGDDTGPEGS